MSNIYSKNIFYLLLKFNYAEFLDAYNKNGEIEKSQERKSLLKEIKAYSEVNWDANLSVDVIHLILSDIQNQLYIVQRADKPENAFLFDKTAGWHISSWENPDWTVIRELSEELDIDGILAESPEEYEKLLSEVDLTKNAVIKKIRKDFWHKSIRKLPDNRQRIKRDNPTLYIGKYTGEVKYKDWEAQDLIKVTIDELQKLFTEYPEHFADDLKEIITNNYNSF